MHHILTLNQINEDLKDRYCDDPEEQLGLHIVPLGILLARPEQEIAAKEIVPSLEYFHHRSGDHITFYCAGFGQYWPSLKDMNSEEESFSEEYEFILDEYRRLTLDRIEVTDRPYPWYFSPKSFSEFVDDLENSSSWRYSGEVELLLLNATNEYERISFELDFRKVISINLNTANKIGAIESVQQLFEDIFRIAREKKTGTHIDSISDKLGAQSFLKGASDTLVEMVPKGILKKIKATACFAVHDKKI